MEQQQKKCLLCEEIIDLFRLKYHINQHLQYKPERCKSCKYNAYSRDEVNGHCAEVNHIPGKVDKKTYLYHVSELIYTDCLRGGPCRSDGPVTAGDRADLPCETLQSEDSSDGEMNRSRTQDRVVVVHESNGSAEVVDFESAKKSRQDSSSTAKKRRVSEGGQRTQIEPKETPVTPVSFSHPSVSVQQTLQDALKSTFGSLTCRICNTKVQSEYLERKRHCAQKHMGHNHNEEDYNELLAEKVRHAFPGHAFNDYQCLQCHQEYKSTPGRFNHVAKRHFLEALKCPIEGCHYQAQIIDEVSQHLKVKHNLKNGRKSLPFDIFQEFDKCRKNHLCRLQLEVHKFFPSSLPQSEKTREPLSAFSRKLASSAVRGGASQSGKVPMKRRVPSETEDSSDEEKEEECSRKEFEKRHAPSKERPAMKKLHKTAQDNEESSDSSEQENEEVDVEHLNKDSTITFGHPSKQRETTAKAVAPAKNVAALRKEKEEEEEELIEGSSTPRTSTNTLKESLTPPQTPKAVKQEVETPGSAVKTAGRSSTPSAAAPEYSNPPPPMSAANPPAHFTARVIPPARAARCFPSIDGRDVLHGPRERGNEAFGGDFQRRGVAGSRGAYRGNGTRGNFNGNSPRGGKPHPYTRGAPSRGGRAGYSPRGGWRGRN